MLFLVTVGEQFSSWADTDLGNLILSYNVNIQPISDAATIVHPANLRGLATHQALELVNGKRRYRAAVIYSLGRDVSDGVQAPDISTIPAIDLKQVEVLHDGAASEYGLDTIAGVINLTFKNVSVGTIANQIDAHFQGFRIVWAPYFP